MSPADTSFQVVILWAAGLSTLVSFCSVIWTIFSGPSRRNASRLDDHGKRLDDHDLRLAKAEQKVETLPALQDMHELQLVMEGLKGELREMRAFIDGNNKVMARLEKVVERQEQFLLEQKK